MALSGTFLLIQMLFSGTAFCFLQTSGGVSGGVGVGGYGGAGGYGGFGGNGGANGGINAGFNGKIGLGCFSVGASAGVNGGAGAGAGNGSVNGGVNGGVSGGVNLQTRCVEEEPEADLSPDQFPTCKYSFEPHVNVRTSVYDIAINDYLAVEYLDADFGMHFTNATVTNNGLYVVLKSDDMNEILVKSGRRFYILEEIRFLWGDSNLVGSDITISNESFPLMMQLVFYTNRSNTFERARYYGGYQIIVQLFEVGPNDNKAISDVTDALNYIKKVGREEYIPQTRYTLEDILPKNNHTYDTYGYYGIMPFPDCGYSNWNVFQTISTISQAQLNKFHQLNGIDREKLSENYPNFNVTFPPPDPSIYYYFSTKF